MDKEVRLAIWRTNTYIPVVYRGTHGFVLAYDITDRESFDSIQDIMSEIEQNNFSDNIPRVLIGLKADLEEKRVVSFEEGKEKADSIAA